MIRYCNFKVIDRYMTVFCTQFLTSNQRRINVDITLSRLHTSNSAFLKVYHFSISQHFPESNASCDRIIYFNKKISWHQIVNLSNNDRK